MTSIVNLWKKLLTETVPVNNFLLTRTVPVNNFLLTGTNFKILNYAHAVNPIPHGGGGVDSTNPFYILEFLLTLLKYRYCLTFPKYILT